MIPAKDRLIVALDVDTLEKADALVPLLAPYVGCFKIGLELMTAEGTPQVVRRIHERGGSVFLDGKFNDIPNTVAKATAQAASLGVKMFTLHACSGKDAIAASAKAKGSSWLLAVTVLTSIDDATSLDVFGAKASEKVQQFARTAFASGADGVICSPQELKILSTDASLRGLRRITPGIRPAWADAQDQKRVMTPAEAIRAGADALVIGRPITNPPASIGDPVEATRRIIEEIENAFN